MKEHGKLFNTAMVQAFLEGRKNQTRRVVDAQNSLVDGNGISKKRWEAAAFDLANATIDNGPSPAGNPGPYLKATCAEGTTHRIYSRVQPGDRIYVKEAHAFVPEPAYRRSTGIIQTINPDDDYEACVYRENFDRARSFPWRPSIFMPRWAARLVFDVVNVRLERLQDISEQDARKEGVFKEKHDWRESEFYLPHVAYRSVKGARYRYSDSRHAFQELWESINGSDSWKANPPVWIYDLQPVGIKPETMPSQSAPATCTLSGGSHAAD
ncbi:hypothetical protein [Vreelandella aquamarina]|uniref:Uncharacterized protein n=1 Tax=Vreelandella aquamarina TaxID=77097 RepID=A0A857GGR3_9GAMM|nr:hypothetical protein [Halomonas meridiana]QHD48452.1 hypothetical protein CTT34_01445 [Halomonas meridiana]